MKVEQPIAQATQQPTEQPTNQAMEQAIDRIYHSYVQAQDDHMYLQQDCEKRSPKLTYDYLQQQGSEQVHATVVVTGSKGKGSVSTMLACILGEHAAVGTLNSPHTITFTDRFKVNQHPISDDMFLQGMEYLTPCIEQMEHQVVAGKYLSPMGIQAMLAQWWFQKCDTQYQIYECGKGAAYDDVNNIPHQYAIINPIFLEHTRELGATLLEIAADKGAVMTPECGAVYVGKQSKEVADFLQREGANQGCSVYLYGRDFTCCNLTSTVQGLQFDVKTATRTFSQLQLPLLGAHQAENCALAIALACALRPSLTTMSIQKGLQKLTMKGRMQILRSTPLLLLDACIHPQSCGAVCEMLAALALPQLTVVIGIPDDKDYLGVAQCMAPWADHIVLTRSQNAHYHFSDVQQKRLAEASIPATYLDSIGAVMNERVAPNLENVCILGTTSVVTEVLQYYATCSRENK